MRQKKAAHANHERWLVSYADFITLLFAFFVVLFASSQADRKKQSQVASAMKTAFSQMGVFDAHSTSPPIAAAGGADSSPIALNDPAAETPEQLKQYIDRILAEQTAQGHIAQGSVTTRISPDGLVVSLHDAGFFSSGSAEVASGSMHILSTIVDSLPNRPVRIEGHTDNVPIHNSQYATNWELSTARATAIARFVIGNGHIDPGNISAAGYAEFHPVASNTTDAGRTENRRVDIILLNVPTRSNQRVPGQAPSR
jgi:chemotaxis protein MotB